MCLLIVALNVKIQQIPKGDTILVNNSLETLKDTPVPLFVTRIIERINGSPDLCGTKVGLTLLLDTMTRRFTRSVYHESAIDVDSKIVLFNRLADKMRENSYNPYSFYGYFSVKAEEGDTAPKLDLRVCVSLTQQGFEEACNTEMIRRGMLPIRQAPSSIDNLDTSNSSNEPSDRSNDN